MNQPENHLLRDLPTLLRRAAQALWGQNSEDARELGRILMGRAVRLEESGVTKGSRPTEVLARDEEAPREAQP